MNFKKGRFFSILNSFRTSHRPSYPERPEKPEENIFIWPVPVLPMDSSVNRSRIFQVGESAIYCRLILRLYSDPAKANFAMARGITVVDLSLRIMKTTAESGACGYFLFEVERDRPYCFQPDRKLPRETAAGSWDCENRPTGEYQVFRTSFAKTKLDYILTIKVTWFPKAETTLNVSGLDNDIGWLLRSGKFSDMVIETADKTRYPVHRVILAARSTVFCAMFSSDTLEAKEKCVKIADLSAETVKEMLHFMYTGFAPEFNCDSATNLMYAAEKYNLNSLKVVCRRYLINHVDTSNAINLLLQADMYNDDLFKEKVLQFISENQKELSESGEFKKLLKDRPSLLLDVLNSKVKS